MIGNSHNDLELLKLQLEWIKQQDRILEEIELQLFEMRKIAQYASAHELPRHEAAQLNKQLRQHQEEIDRLKNQLNN